MVELVETNPNILSLNLILILTGLYLELNFLIPQMAKQQLCNFILIVLV